MSQPGVKRALRGTFRCIKHDILTMVALVLSLADHVDIVLPPNVIAT